MGPFSYAENKTGGRGLLAVLAVQVSVVSLESLTVKPAAADVLPGGFPAVSLDGFLAPLRHGGFELIGQGFGLCLSSAIMALTLIRSWAVVFSSLILI